MSPLIMLLILAVIAYALVTVGATGVKGRELPCPRGDCVPRAALLKSQKRSYHRLLGWRAMERDRNRWKRIAAFRARRQYRTDIPWLNDALCIHSFESTDWHQQGHHFGGMQFSIGTWHSVGGRGNPAKADPIEQLYRAFRVWSRDGGSWREWTTAGMCGL